MLFPRRLLALGDVGRSVHADTPSGPGASLQLISGDIKEAVSKGRSTVLTPSSLSSAVDLLTLHTIQG